MTDSVEITVLGGSVRLLQPAHGFRTSLDSVILAAACPARAGDHVLDMGCGVGGAGFCVLHRVPGSHATGIDIKEDFIALARQNAELNAVSNRCSFVQEDIRHFDVKSPDDRFDHVICNPPFFEAGHYAPSPAALRAVARGHSETEMRLKDWIKAGLRLLKSGGSLTIIHRADVTDRIIRRMGRSFGAIDIIPLWPKAGRDAKRVIIRGIKDRQSPCQFSKGVVLHREDGEYTEEADKILRQGAALL